MDATPRFRLFDGSRHRGGGIADRQEEEGAAQTLPRRRMVTSVSAARARRRNRRRPGTHRGGPGLVLLSWLSGAASSRRRRTVLALLLLAVCTAGALVSARLLAWAAAAAAVASSPSPSSSSSSVSFSSLKPPRHASSGADADAAGAVGASSSSGDNAGRRPRGDQNDRRRSAVSLGPDAIPAVVLVEHRSAGGGGGGARRASSLDARGGEDGGGRLPRSCRNTAQGAELVADSEGRVCRRSEVDGGVDRPGCCAERSPSFSFPPVVAGVDDDKALAAAPEEKNYVDRDISASRRAAAAGAATEEVRRGHRLELVALPPLPLTKVHGGAAAESQPEGGEGAGRGGFPPEQALSTPFSCWSCDEGGDDGVGVGDNGGDNGGDGGDSGGGGGGGGYSSCCRSYEFCVSCCQAPWREREREAIREAAARAGHPVYRELGLSHDGGGGGGAELHRKTTPHQLLRGAPEGEASPPEEEAREREQQAAFAHCAFRCRTYSGSVAHENSYRGPQKHCFGRFRPPAEPAPGVFALGAQGQAVPAGGGESEVVRNGGGQVAPPLQLDPLLALLA